MSRVGRAMVLVAAVLVAGCSGTARPGGAPGPAVDDPVVPTASTLPTTEPAPGPTTSAAADPPGRPGPTTTVPPVPRVTPGGPAAPQTVRPPAVVPVVPAPRTSAPPRPAPKPPPATRPGGAPQGAAVIDQVDSGLDYDGFRQAQLGNCTPEGQALGCWTFALVGKAGDRVCRVSPPSRAVVPYGRTITITTLPVPEDMTCADYEAARSTSAPGG